MTAQLAHQWRRDAYGNNYCPTCDTPAYLCSTNFPEGPETMTTVPTPTHITLVNARGDWQRCRVLSPAESDTAMAHPYTEPSVTGVGVMVSAPGGGAEHVVTANEADALVRSGVCDQRGRQLHVRGWDEIYSAAMNHRRWDLTDSTGELFAQYYRQADGEWFGVSIDPVRFGDAAGSATRVMPTFNSAASIRAELEHVTARRYPQTCGECRRQLPDHLAGCPAA